MGTGWLSASALPGAVLGTAVMLLRVRRSEASSLTSVPPTMMQVHLPCDSRATKVSSPRPGQPCMLSLAERCLLLTTAVVLAPLVLLTPL